MDDAVAGISDAAEDIEDAPELSKGWLSLITDAEKAYNDYHDRCDSIDKLYANLEKLANTTRDRQFQMFWANIEVLKPAVYSRPPIPVVTPRFKDRRPLARTTSELLERTTIVGFEIEDMDSVMRLVRDDVVVVARGAVWLRYEAKGDDGNLTERVCIEHVDRKDFLHDPARKWKEVDWVAKCSWLTAEEFEERFPDVDDDKPDFRIHKDPDGDGHGFAKCKVWELWSKSQNRVVWITEGVEKVLDSDKPHLKLDGFFPCPRPAYATVQRSTLIPVPDMVFYKDQLEEINELTARISALTEAVRLRGFYPSGAGEIGDAVEAAMKATSDNAILIPIANWALIGQGGVKDMIVWIPLDMVVAAIAQLVEMRRQLIDDVYQITGLSDIMRGSTDAKETLGAQQLKSQYGSIRIRDRQDELIRLARDVTRIAAEIIAENFSKATLLEMSQMQIATNADIASQVKDIERQIKEAQSDPQIKAMVEKEPEKAQQALQQAEGQIAELKDAVTIEKVMKFLKDQRLRPFILDIETDSTIAPDEDAQKQRATEYLTAVGGFMGQAMPLVQADPAASGVVAEMLKFTAGLFRAGREIQSTIEEYADQMKERASQPQGNPEAEAAQAAAQADQAAAQAKMQVDTQKLQIDAQKAQASAQQAQAKLELQQQKDQAAAQLAQAKLEGETSTKAAQIEADKWKALLAARTSIEVAEIGAQAGMQVTQLEAALDAQLGIQEHEQEIEKLGMQQDHQAGLQSQSLDAEAQQAERAEQQEPAE